MVDDRFGDGCCGGGKVMVVVVMIVAVDDRCSDDCHSVS